MFRKSMLCYVSAVSLSLCVLIAMTATVTAQSHSFQIKEEGKMFMIPELGAMTSSDEGKLTVDFMPPAGDLPKAYRDVDLKNGDIIMMANGKKMKSAADLEKLYDALKVGDEIKLGIKRDKGMLIASFKKADEKDLPKRKIMTMSLGGDGGGKMTTTEGGIVQTMTFGGDGQALSIVPELGLLLIGQDDKVVLANLLPNAVAVFGENEISEGDVLSEINGKKVTTTAGFEEIYNAIPVGDMFRLQFVADKSEIFNTTIKKPKAQTGGMMIRKKTE